MNLIYNLMGEQGPGLFERLNGAGLSTEQAQDFLPVALNSVMEGLQKVDLMPLLGADSGTQTSSLIEYIDITALAGSLGGNSMLVNSALQAIIPQVFNFLNSNPAIADLLSMSADNNVSGLATRTNGLFH